ncbi:uncharacterized protein [Antedon mediterranea]|uniref:uncharacterized protein n=1 Tax=Antedon mediterranea TaxID=105859 RepID=UPI003AF587D5
MKLKIFLCMLIVEAIIFSVRCQTTQISEEVMVEVTTKEDVPMVANVTPSQSPANNTTTAAPPQVNMTTKDSGESSDSGESKEEEDEDSGDLSGGAIAGIIIGVILGLVLIVIIVYVIVSKVCTKGDAQPAPAKKSEVRYTEVEKGEPAADKIAEEDKPAADAEVKA